MNLSIQSVSKQYRRDFWGRLPAARAQGIPLAYLLITLLLLAAAWFGRRRQALE